MNLVLLKNISLVGLYWGSYGSKSPTMAHLDRTLTTRLFPAKDLVHMTKVLESLFE